VPLELAKIPITARRPLLAFRSSEALGQRQGAGRRAAECQQALVGERALDELEPVLAQKISPSMT